jgi:hypothetical protein
MRSGSLIPSGLVTVLLAGSVVLGAVGCGKLSAPAPARLSVSAAADTLGDHYAALEVLADSVGAAQAADDATPSELVQVTAQNLARRIQTLSSDYVTLSLAMTAADYERGLSLWMRLALAQAALDLLREDAARLGSDPTTGPDDVRDLADRLSGVLELGRVTGRVASRTFGPEAAWRQHPPPPGPCSGCRGTASRS